MRSTANGIAVFLATFGTAVIPLAASLQPAAARVAHKTADVAAQASTGNGASRVRHSAHTLTLSGGFKVAAKSGEASTLHPLDPLSESELKAAVRVLQTSGKLKEKDSLVYVVAQEPPKQEVIEFVDGSEFPRHAFAVVYGIDSNETHEIVIDLKSKSVLSDKLIPGVQPMQIEEDNTLGIEILSRDSAWKKGLERRGITNADDVHIEMFVVGNPINIVNPKKQRLLRATPFYRKLGTNSFGEPIEGLFAQVNLTTGEVFVRDREEIIPLAGSESDYFDTSRIGKLRKPTKPLITTQPDGPSFDVNGNEVTWEGWRFRYRIDPRDGLVLHTVSYNDAGRERSILHRAGVSEISVPYGAPGEDWVWRSPIDEGEYGLGRLTTTLRPGLEVPGHATIIDVPYANSKGDVLLKTGAVALWEQDAGIIWEHHDDDADRTVTRRGRQLVIAHMFTLGNYDYMSEWTFNQDGSIDVGVTLNGDVLSQGVKLKDCGVCAIEPDEQGRLLPSGAERYGTLVAPHIVGINHQHFFCYRLDFDVDGTKNSVYELNLRPVLDNRSYLEQNGFSLERTLFRREEEARRSISDRSGRCWKVFNPTSARYLGHFPGYLVAPTANTFPFSHKESYNRKRAGFLDHHFWATRFQPDELYASGDYPVASPGGEGLPTWSGADSIEDQDVVVWYTVGISHAPRVEDWPVMPAARMGFKILPDSFFKRNPALDLPDPESQR